MQDEEWDFSRKDKLRQRLFEALQVGRLSLDEANALAAEAGTNLNPSDDPDNYDPSELPHWSMPMALSWVTFRSLFAVRSAWGHFKSSQFDWKPTGPSLPLVPPPLPVSSGESDFRTPPPLPVPRGWQLRQQSVLTVSEMIRLGSPWGDEFADGPFGHSKGIHRSYRDLIKALATNKVPSMGVDLRNGRDASPTSITAEEWSLLQLMEFEAGDAWGFRPSVPVFINVLVERQSLINQFEALAAESGNAPSEPLRKAVADRSPKSFSAMAIEGFKAQVVAAVVASPDAPPQGGGREHWIAQGRQQNLPKRIAEAAYVAALEDARDTAPQHGWSKQGRRPKVARAE